MAKALRCPGCQAKLALDEDGLPPTRCPGCGAKFSVKARPKAGPPPAPPEPVKPKQEAEEEAADADEGAAERLVPPAVLTVLSVFTALTASLLLVAVSLRFGDAVRSVVAERAAQNRYAVGTPPPAAPPPDVKAPTPAAPVEPAAPAWELRPDPSSSPAKPIEANPAVAIRLFGRRCVFAEDDGPFAAEFLLHPDYAPQVRVYDLRTGEMVANRFMAVMANEHAVLSADGQTLLVRGVEKAGDRQFPLGVWPLWTGEPPVMLARGETPAGCGFGPGAGEVVTLSLVPSDSAQRPPHQLRVWNSATGQVARDLGNLPARIATRQLPRSGPTFDWGWVMGLSPGKGFAVIGSLDSVDLVGLWDGRPAASLPVAKHRPLQAAVRFIDDGATLVAVLDEGSGSAERGKRLRAWDMRDGKALSDTLLDVRGDWPTDGLPLVEGPQPGTVIWGRDVFDVVTGRVLYTLPAFAVRWLSGDRLLAYGPADTVPEGAELPPATPEAVLKGWRLNDEKFRANDPAELRIRTWGQLTSLAKDQKALWAMPFDRAAYQVSVNRARKQG